MSASSSKAPVEAAEFLHGAEMSVADGRGDFRSHVAILQELSMEHAPLGCSVGRVSEGVAQISEAVDGGSKE